MNVEKAKVVLLVTLAVVLLTGCQTMNSLTTRRPFVRKGDRGFKPIDQVAPHARAMVQGKMTLDECLRQPESIADGGAGCLRAIRDIPVTAP